MTMSNEITEFYKGKNVLVTGAGGFFGKLLIQKLLRSTKDVTIYAVVRQKNNVSSEDRFKIILEDPVFNKLKEEFPTFSEKIIVIDGDLSYKSLNLSEDVIKMLQEEINIVFHCAAELNMKSKLKDAINTNVRGTFELVAFCKGMRNLKSLIVTSTLFAHSHHTVIEEKQYKVDIKPELIISMAEHVNEDTLESIKDKLQGDYINTYCYTKALSEAVVFSTKLSFPIGVFRPSIVMSTYKDPIPGWTDNAYGALGVILSVLLGLLRVAYFRIDTKADLIPADLCINALICAAWDISENRQYNNNNNCGPVVYNFTNNSKKLTWGEFRDLFMNNYRFAFAKAIWIPTFITCNSRIKYVILHWFLQSLPAYTCDLFLAILKKGPKFKKMNSNVTKLHDVLTFFNRNEWTIVCNNTNMIWKRMSVKAKAQFGFDTSVINEDQYFQDISYGLKKYFLKENVTDLENDRKRLLRYQLLHRIIKFCIWAALIAACCKMYALNYIQVDYLPLHQFFLSKTDYNK